MAEAIKRITDRERDYVLEVLAAQFRTSSGGLMTKSLEKKFTDIFQSKFAISFINGTATMHAVLAAADVGPGDEVIVPPLTMASTTFAVLQTGALPVFADIDPRTWTIDPNSIVDRVTSRTKAIIPVAIYGLAPDMDAIMAVAERHNLFVLEDDAQCFLGYYKGRIVGSIGHASSFSFQSSKHMTSGEGGMVITNDEGLAEKVRRINSLGYAAVKAAVGKGKITKEMIQDPGYERHVSMGWNYRMPELCAAVALGQLERLEELVGTRIKVAKLYQQAVSGCNWLIPQATPADYVHSYWTYVLKLAREGDLTWHDFRRKYLEYGGDGIYGAWQLTHLEPLLRGVKLDPDQTQKFQPGLCPVAESIQSRLLQFKTNYFDPEQAEAKAEALASTIDHFGR